ncbi:MAG: hypothetical protein HC763_29880 [Hydrococcus sp. CRU_1_1]|nr:hypothetical protein [Hydrococcus sp. CRU_1_1]
MNNIQLKIRIDAVEASYTKDGSLVVNGTCSFKYYDNKENKVRSLSFQAFGQAAVSLQQSGVGSVQVISGRMTVYKPTQEYPNHRCLLTIERNLCVTEGASTNRVVEMQQPPAMRGATVTKTPVATTAPAFASTNGSAAEIYDEEIPF